MWSPDKEETDKIFIDKKSIRFIELCFDVENPMYVVSLFKEDIQSNLDNPDRPPADESNSKTANGNANQWLTGMDRYPSQTRDRFTGMVIQSGYIVQDGL